MPRNNTLIDDHDSLPALFLVIVNLILGVIGAITYGMLAAGNFLLPTATVIIALMWPKQYVFFFSVIAMSLLAYAAYGFIMGQLTLPVSAEALLTNGRYWIIYIFCMGFFLFISCTTILSYRSMVKTLTAQAMNMAKKAGNNKFCIFTPSAATNKNTVGSALSK